MKVDDMMFWIGQECLVKARRGWRRVASISDFGRLLGSPDVSLRMTPLGSKRWTVGLHRLGAQSTLVTIGQ